MRLLLALLTVVASPRHTPSACALAWNRGASAALHAVVAHGRARAAFIDSRAVVGTDTWSKTGKATSTSAAGCSIAFVVRAGGTIQAWGPWSGGAIGSWHVVHTARPFPGPRNARVHADGTVGFTG